MVFDGVAAHDRERRARELLAQVGLADRADHRPDRCPAASSSGSRSRSRWPTSREVLLADEPTGELDTATAGEIFELLRRLNRELGVTIVVATHDPLVSTQVSRTVAIRDGRVSSETLRQRTVSAAGRPSRRADGVRGARPGRPAAAAARARRGAGLERRVRLDLETDHIAVWPDRDRVRPTPSATGASDPRRGSRARRCATIAT